MPSKPYPSVEELHERYAYDPDTGILSCKRKLRNCPPPGRPVGRVSASRDSIDVSFKNRKLRVHRVVFKMVYGYDPYMVDHIDGDPTNNRLSNLREATDLQNQANSRRKSGKALPKGVLRNSGRRPYKSRLRHNGHMLHLGYFMTVEEAALAYHAKAVELYGEFARLDYVPPAPLSEDKANAR